MTFDDVRDLALAWPAVEDSTCYGTPALKVKGKLLARLKEDGDSLVVRMDFDERDIRMEAEPDVFYITDHYRGWPYVLLRLSKASPEVVKALLSAHGGSWHPGSWSRPSARPEINNMAAPRRWFATLRRGWRCGLAVNSRLG